MNKGIWMTLIGGASWGFSGVCGEYLFNHTSFSPITLCMIRLLFSGIILLLISYFTSQKDLKILLHSPYDIIQTILFGILGLAFCQSTYLMTIQYSNASTATVLQYINPIWFIILTCLYFRRRPYLIEIVCVILALMGTFFIATKGSFTSLALTKEGLFWGIISSLSVVTYSLIPKRLLRKYSSLPIMGLGMFAGGVFVLPFSSIHYETLSYFDMIAFFGIVIIGTIFAFSMYLIGVSEIGAVKGSMLASVEPIVAAIVGYFWLHTRLTYWDILGFIFIIMTVFLLTKRPITQDTL